jgi:hypothetical protein
MNVRPKELVFENIIFNNGEEVPPPTYYEVNQQRNLKHMKLQQS